MSSLARRTLGAGRFAVLLLLVGVAIIRMSPACAVATSVVTHVAPMSDCMEMPASRDPHESSKAHEGLQPGTGGCLALAATIAGTAQRAPARAMTLLPPRTAVAARHPTSPLTRPPRSA